MNPSDQVTSTPHEPNADCEIVRERLADYLGDELSPGQREVFSDHLRACDSCRHEVESLAGAGDLVTAAATSEERAVRATAGIGPPPLVAAPRSGSGRVGLGFAAAAGLVLTFGLGYGLGASGRTAGIGTVASASTTGLIAPLARAYTQASAARPQSSSLGRALISIANR